MMEEKMNYPLGDVRNRADFDTYIAMMEDVYRFVMYSMDEYDQVHDYGTGDRLNMVEMHTLNMIDQQPGLCVKDVARLWNRTLGAASRNVNKLLEKGLVTKEKLPGNGKNIHIYPTEAGKKLAQLHRQYDRDQIAQIMNCMLVQHTEAELQAFWSVIRSGIEIYQKK